MQTISSQENYWNQSVDEVLAKIQTQKSGLTDVEILKRHKQYGLNSIHKNKLNVFSIFFRQITSNPLLIILSLATFISFSLGERISSYYIFSMIIVSIVLGLWNEYSAEKTVENLLKKITPEALVERDNEKQEIPVSQLTIGDIVLLSQGSIIPADLRLFEANNLEVNESSLTGEAKSVHKESDTIPVTHADITNQKNIGFMGTIVESGSGKGIVIRIGKYTEFGKIAKSATFIKPTTEFQKGLGKFGELIIKVIIILTSAIFCINALLQHDLLQSVLFALAIAVGLTPELLPIIVTVSLSHGAGKLAKKHVVAKRLLSIENLGNMDILCTDKTGTLTEGKITVVDYFNLEGKKDPHILTLALHCNAAVVNHKVMGNGIDVALWEYALTNKITLDKHAKKLDEEEFDYNRKAMFSIIKEDKKITLIAKGAPEEILELCPHMKNAQHTHKKLLDLRNDGYRVISLASKPMQIIKENYTWEEDVHDLEFHGFITFLDIPKKSAQEALLKLHNLNVQTKVITGDNEIITQKICEEVGMDVKRIITGPHLEKLSHAELKHVVNTVDIFTRVSPNQKLQIILALQESGHTVGYLGDGINDLPALHNADVGISVNTAVDVAKDAASIVLLRKGLDVIADGIIEGRKTFNNTIKYILMGTSSNFGNMFSAAGASFFLPFLPMTPVQILLTNSLYDISQLTIPSDNVDPESLVKPRHWNIDFIKNYMLFFGPLSSIYDFLTFSIMLYFFHAKGALFQTGWFIESLATEILVVFVIRTARTPFFMSKPSKWLAITCLGIVGVGILLPFTPLAEPLGFTTPPPLYFAILMILITTYVFLVEKMKNTFLKKFSL
jgi:P-type Mg2+ transporter